MGETVKLRSLTLLLPLLVSALLVTPKATEANGAASNADGEKFLHRLALAAEERVKHPVRYDPGYLPIAYPGGDVPPDTGVCTDEVIRIYRALGIDLQKEVHEDMLADFAAYPSRSIWKLAHPDSNIDHRRVPNLRVFFTRHGQSLPITTHASDYQPGDLVTWDLGHGLTHIGTVVNGSTLLSGRHMIEHNIGAGPRIEDVLFDWKITGHYRYFGPQGGAAGKAGSAKREIEIKGRESISGRPAGI